MSRIMRVIASPWVLLSAVLIPGGVWLASNLWVITSNLDKPYALLAGPALVGSIVLGWLFVAFFKTIMSWCKQAWQAFQTWHKQDGSTFWLVIYIFLIVSVLESGTYFNELLGSNSLYGSLGYAAAFVVDLIAVECMRARLGATRMRDKTGKSIYLLGVIACAGLSAWANTYTSLSHYHTPAGTMLPTWMVTLAPWTGMAFPLLIILMSFAADYTADQTSTKLDPDAYQIQENKRFKLLEIQRDMLKKRVEVESEIDVLSIRSKAAKGPRVLFAKKQQVIESIMQEVNPQLQALVEQNKALQEQLAIMVKQAQQNQELQRQDRAIIQHQIESIQAQRDADMEGIIGHIKEAGNVLSQRVNEAINDSIQARVIDEIEVLKSLFQQDRDTDQHQAIKQENTYLLIEAGNEEESEVKARRKGGYQIQNDPEVIALLGSYPFLERWLSTSAKSATVAEIVNVTGHTSKMVGNRVKDGTFCRTKNPNLFTVESVVRWLKVAPLPKSKAADDSVESEAGNDAFDSLATEEESVDFLEEKQSNHNGHNGHSNTDVSPLSFSELEV